MSKHLIIASVDALTFEDLEYAKTLPFFSKVLNEGSLIERVQSIYPSSTHPAHASIISGAPAGVTGIVNNREFNRNEPLKSTHVFNDLSDIKCETLLHSAKKAGLSVACSSWPVTSRAGEFIDYLVPNAMNSDFVGHEDNPLEVYRALGAQECVMDIIEKAVSIYGYENRHPEMDDLQAYCSAEIIKRFKPNLLLTHPGFVDFQRHHFGVFNDKVNYSLEETDRWLSIVYDAVVEAGIEKDTDFIIIGDHGQINVMRTVYPNYYLKKAGFIKTDSEGNITSYDAYAQNAEASAQVYLSRPNDKKLYDEVYSLLLKMADEGVYGFEKVFTASEVKEKYGLYGDFSFALETDGYSDFGEEISDKGVSSYDKGSYLYCHATHGYEPTKGPQTTLLGFGPSIKKGARVKYGNLLNHAPTFAKILGIDFTTPYGKTVTEILND